jgi:DNA primase large subunit
MYSQLASGISIPHMARYDIGTFLIAIGMPLEQIDILFSNAPNYKQKMTLYHLNRIKRLDLSPPSCKKIREEHGFCPLKTCSETHPLLFYRRKMSKKKVLKKSSS